MQHGNIAYFLSGAPAEVARYDLSTSTFLDPILLDLPPTAFYIDDDGIYLAFTRTMARMDLDGSNYTALANAVGTVRELVTFGDNLYGNASQSSPNFIRINKTTGDVLQQPDFFYSMTGISSSPGTMKIFGRSVGISPADILQITLASDGTLGAQNDSPYHGDYPSASATYMVPDDAKVVDDAGIVYSTADLSYVGSLNGSFEHVTFNNGEPLVLRADKVVRYSIALLPAGEATLLSPVHSIFAHAGNLFGFYNDALGNLALEIVDIQSIVPPGPGEPVDPVGLVYVPDDAVAANDGSILILSKANKSIFRWSPAQGSYTQSIPLVTAPAFFAYSAIDDRVYLGYDDGRITKIDLITGVEAPFTSVPSMVLGMSVADPFVFAVDPAGAWVSHFTFDSSGQLISQVEWNYFSQEYIWNAANRKMYFFRDDSSPNDLIWEDIDANGVIGASMDSPFHSSEGIRHPIRVAANGSFVLLGSGRIYNAQTLELLNSLPNDVEDAQWRADGSIAAIRDLGGQLQLQELNRNFLQQKAIDLPSFFGKLVLDGNDIHIIWDKAGVPQFLLWNFGTDDIDGDGVSDANDEFAVDPTEWVDSDVDGIGDNADPDDDNDGYDDLIDAFPFDPSEWADTDGDGSGNNADPDDDNDGVPDAEDLYPLGRFDDARPGYWAFWFVEALERAGITGGCGNDEYCPEDPVTRAQLAVFLERGMHGSDFIPPQASGNIFSDVAANDFAAAFIEQLFIDGITGGCGSGDYCPNDNVTRAHMAVFLLRAKFGAGFTPPPATGVFNDVPLGSFAVDWIEALADEGITGGCGGGNYCPNDPVTRAQMAVFLVRTFEL
jgi:hypothetical protein